LKGAAIRTLISDILQTVETLDGIVEELASYPRLSEPKPIETRGYALLAHDFYTGLESIFERIAAEINSGYPSGPNSHARLLRSMAMDVERVRPAVISRELFEELDELRKFRHFVRHAYGVPLRWERVKEHLERIVRIYPELKKRLNDFLGFLSELADSLG